VVVKEPEKLVVEESIPEPVIKEAAVSVVATSKKKPAVKRKSKR
jgi:hypothetical protein